MLACMSLSRYSYVIDVRSPIFCYRCVEHIKLHTCVKFHDHQRIDNEVKMGATMAPPLRLKVPKKPVSNRVKSTLK